MVTFKLEQELCYGKAECKEKRFRVKKANSENASNNWRDIV